MTSQLQNISQIGFRIRKFRLEKGLTQQELELAIGASFGHISRIESGKVNPDKETLLQISDILELNLKEKLILLGLNLDPINNSEIQEAILQTKDYFNSTQNPVYLADDFWFTWWGNEKMFDLIGAPSNDNKSERDQFIKARSGTHILEWLFDKNLGVRSKMPVERWPEIAINQCTYFIGLIDYYHRIGQGWLEKLMDGLNKLNDFSAIWKQAEKKWAKSCQRSELSVTYIYQKDWIEFFIANSRVNTMPRFMVVEYVPCAIYKNGDLKNIVKL